MPLPRFKKLSPEKQRRLLDAAQDEFAARGYEMASLNRIIAATGVSKGAMYYYFSDKADLFVTVVEDTLSDIAAAVGELPRFDDAPGFWHSIRRYLERAIEFVMRNPKHGALARAVYQNHGGILSDLVRRGTELIEGLLRAGQSVGAVRDDVPLDMLARATTGLAIAIDQWLADNWDRLDGDELPRHVDNGLELCRDLVSPRGASS